MKKFTFLRAALLLAAAVCALFAFAACGGGSSLAAPQGLYVDETTLVLSWNEVQDARRYEVSYNGTVQQVRTPYYSLTGLEAGEYELRVRAVSGEESVKSSEWSQPLSFVRERESGLVYRLIDGGEGYEVASDGGLTGEITIEDVYRGRPVTGIGEAAFRSNDAVTSVVLGQNVTYIGERAFSRCVSLTRIEIPAGVTKIGRSAFQGCKALTSIALPEGVESVEESVFSGCDRLETVTLPRSLEEIGDYAFSDCFGLRAFTLPDGVISLGEYAFSGCGALTEMNFSAALSKIGNYAFYRCTALEEVALPRSLEEIGAYAFNDCSALARVVVPDSVHTIGNYAFLMNPKVVEGVSVVNSALTEVELGSGLKKLGADAFLGSMLWATAEDLVVVDGWIVDCRKNFGEEGDSASTILTLPDGIVGIADYAFYKAKGLTRVECNKVKYIGAYAFCDNEELMSVLLGEETESIGESAFRSCGLLTTVSFPESGVSVLKEVGDYAFAHSKITELALPDTVEHVGTFVLYGTSVGAAANGVLYAGNWAVGFVKGRLPEGNLQLKAGTVGIAQYAFMQSELTGIIIPEGVTCIGRSAFYGCEALQSVIVPSSVRTVGDYAFYGCSALEMVTFNSYQGESGVVLPQIERIGRSAFYGCASLADLKLPDSVHAVGDYAFYGCASLTQMTLGDRVTQLGRSAFGMCTALVSVSLGEGVQAVGAYTFNGCTALASVSFRSALTEVGDYAFYGCTALTEAAFSAVRVGDYAFYGCTAGRNGNDRAQRVQRLFGADGAFSAFDADGGGRLRVPRLFGADGHRTAGRGGGNGEPRLLRLHPSHGVLRGGGKRLEHALEYLLPSRLLRSFFRRRRERPLSHGGEEQQYRHGGGGGRRPSSRARGVFVRRLGNC